MKRLNHVLEPDLDHILDHTRDDFESLRGERIFITGGTGFFGCWLLESLLWANKKLALGTRAVVLSRDPKNFVLKAPHLAQNLAVTLVQGNVENFIFPDGDFPFIIHAATEASTKLNEKNPLSMVDTIINGTRHVLDFSQECEARRFLLTSSGSVYGPQPSELSHIPETYRGAPDPLDKKSAYGQGKRIAEHLCSLYAKPGLFDPVIARCFAFVGPYLPLDQHFAIGNFIRDGLNGGPIVINGDGTPFRSYLYTADLAIWLWTILFRGNSCYPYNVGSADPINIKSLAGLVGKVIDPKIKILITKEPDPSKPKESYVPSIVRAKNELGLEKWVPLNEAIQKTCHWIKK